MTGPTITLQPINALYAGQLAHILNTDETLCRAMGTPLANFTPEAFLAHNEAWCQSRGAEMFAIVLDGSAIGSISLSHPYGVQKSARVGYWLASAYWGRGCTTQAFENILALAYSKGIRTVTASILADNPASLRIWEKFGACFEPDGERWKATIILGKD